CQAVDTLKSMPGLPFESTSKRGLRTMRVCLGKHCRLLAILLFAVLLSGCIEGQINDLANRNNDSSQPGNTVIGADSNVPPSNGGSGDSGSGDSGSGDSGSGDSG